MNKVEKEFKRKDEELKQLRKDANRKVNLTYLLAGAYSQALDIATEAMDSATLELRYRDKKITNEIKQLTKRLSHLIEDLQEDSVLVLPEDESLTHENTIHMMFALFMAIVESAGIDKYSDLRVYNMYNIVSKYPRRVNFKFHELKECIAFNFVRDKIDNDETLSMDSNGDIYIDGKKLMTYESRDQSHSSEVSREEA